MKEKEVEKETRKGRERTAPHTDASDSDNTYEDYRLRTEE